MTSSTDADPERVRMNRVIVVTFWKLRICRVFDDLFPDLAQNWVDDVREEHPGAEFTLTRENVERSG